MIAGDVLAYERLLQRVEPGSRLLRAWPLAGGVSAQVAAVEYRSARGVAKKLVVRRHSPAAHARDPHLTANEFRLLQQLHAAGVPVPGPYYFDHACEFFPTPAVVLAYVEGTTAFAPDAAHIQQFAQQLARIHALDWAALDISFLPQHATLGSELPRHCSAPGDEARIWQTLAAYRPQLQCNAPVLLHGDYWPGNTLWRDGRLVAVIDWEDAAIGDPLADLANSRLEIFWAGGAGALEAFTQQYQMLSPIGLVDLAYWELRVALLPAAKLGTWGLNAETEQSMRAGLRWFVDHALERLAQP